MNCRDCGLPLDAGGYCLRPECPRWAEEPLSGASDTSPVEQASGRSRPLSVGSGRRPDPTCLHCGTRCGSMQELDIHLRFECEALGRKEQE